MEETFGRVWANRYFWLALVLAALLTFVLGVIHTSLGITAALGSLFLLILLALPRRALIHTLITGAILAFLWLIVLPNLVHVGCKPPSAETKQNLYAIQLAVERYATDFDGYYPVDMEAVRATGYLPEFPWNYYIHATKWQSQYEDDERRMVNLGGINALEQQHPLFASGNFVYAPRLAVIDGELRATGYRLYGLGGVLRFGRITSVEDPAFVIIELGDDLDRKTTNRLLPY